MIVVEFHTRNPTVRLIDEPDHVVFDLDPGEDVSWAHLGEAAALMQTCSTSSSLKGWLQTSGGKGSHRGAGGTETLQQERSCASSPSSMHCVAAPARCSIAEILWTSGAHDQVQNADCGQRRLMAAYRL